MKIYKHIPKKIIRVEFLQRGVGCKNLMFEDCTSEQVMEFVKQEFLKQKVKNVNLDSVTVQIRCMEVEGKLIRHYKAFTVHGVDFNNLHSIIESAANEL